MKLILQAIKALFRKVENAISHNVAKLQKQIDSVKSTAKKDAEKAKAAADEAQATADNAKETAEAAQTTANSVAESANTFHVFGGTRPVALTPEKTTPLEVGEKSGLDPIDSKLVNLITNGKVGDRTFVNLTVYRSSDGRIDVVAVLLTKVNSNSLRGGAWFDQEATPKYFDVKVYATANDSRVLRCV
jgi:hypothetical protein